MAVIDVIKYDGTPDVLAWKYPSDELGTWTQLVVNESQEAVLFKGGQALDVFTSGRHTLATANIPLLNKLVNLPFGGDSPFKAEVWFINKLHNLDVKWGTLTPIQIQDPKYHVFIPVRAFGQFGLKIEESKEFLIKLVGVVPEFNQETMVKYFKGLYLTKVKDLISSYILKKGISVLEINAYLDEISLNLQENIKPALEEYGIRLINFYVNDINVPEEDSAVIQLKGALAKKAEMDIVGYNYTQERSFDTLEGAATNTGGGQGGMMGAGIGLGMGLGIGNTFGQQAVNMTENINISNNNKNKKACPKCNAELNENQKFCHECGTSLVQVNECPKCKTKIPNNTKFCPECGEKI